MAKAIRAVIIVPGHGQDFPDNALPGDGDEIDNELPGGSGGHPWLPGHDRPDRIDNGLPIAGHPGNALPGHGRPDNSLPVAPVRPANPIVLPPIFIDPGFGNRPPVDPGYGGGRVRPDRPDNSLPGRPSRPDNSLPGSGARPDQGLPGEQPGVDNGLPRPPGHPDNGLPPGLGNGNFPIFLPPGSVGPGVPTLPIFLPTYLPPGSCLVIPVTGAHVPAPKEEAPAGTVPAVLWYGPGTAPTVAYVKQPAAPAEPK